MEREIKEFLTCKCTDSSHLMIMTCSDEEKSEREVLCEILLCPRKSFFQRLGCAINYLLGIRSRKLGPFDSVILGNEHAEKLRRMAEYLEGE